MLPVRLGEQPIVEDEVDAIVAWVMTTSSEAGIDDSAALDDLWTKSRYAITTRPQAQGAVERWSDAARFIAEAEAQAKAMRAKVNDWLAETTRRARIVKALYERLLSAWAIEERHASHGRTKTQPLIGGKVRTREAPPKIEVVDHHLTIAWLIAHGRLDLLKIEVNVQRLRDEADIAERIDGYVITLSDGRTWLVQGMERAEVGEIVTVDGIAAAVQSATPVRRRVAFLRGEEIPGTEVSEPEVTASVGLDG